MDQTPYHAFMEVERIFVNPLAKLLADLLESNIVWMSKGLDRIPERDGRGCFGMKE
jgi:hypothetical protein